MASLISPSVYFESVTLPPGTSGSWLVKGISAEVDCFLCTEATMQHHGFLSSSNRNTVGDIKKRFAEKDQRLKSMQSNVFQSGNISRGELDIDTESVSSANSTTPQSTPRGKSAKPFSDSLPVPTPPTTPLGTSTANAFAFPGPTEGKTKQKTGAGVGLLFPAVSADESNKTVTFNVPPLSPTKTNVASLQPSTPGNSSNNFDDMFAAFDNKSSTIATSSETKFPGASHEDLKADLNVLLQEELLCVKKNNTIDKFEYGGTVTIMLGNFGHTEGELNLEVNDEHSYVQSIVVNPTLLRSGDHGVSKNSGKTAITATLSTNRKSTPVAKFTFANSFRPIIFQANTSATWSSNSVTIRIQLSINPTYKNIIIEGFTVMLSLGSLKNPRSSDPTPSFGPPSLKPTGSFNSASNIISWSSNKYNPEKQQALQFEAILNFTSDSHSAASSDESFFDRSQQPVIVKGLYSNIALSGITLHANSVKYLDSNVSRGFDLNSSESRRTKFEYRFV